jgi:hypothetical protein
MRFEKAFLAVLLLASGAAVLGGCDRRGETPGQKLDRALDKTGEKVKEAGEAIKSH